MLLIAFVGVVIGIFLIGFSFKVLLFYPEISWSGCFTFASIISATDPVAVVALLKELGTPLKFNILLEGESLLNDGTSMVFFAMFTKILKNRQENFLSTVFNFFWLSLGGFVVGAVVCFVLVFWLKKIV